ncbi:MAG: hypothetical protein PHP52_12475 [Bacteroidales bacterium]|nr:hypothetical protein [Bacteroidales bacterium]MDD4217671.1 hypothetical protein [Bacteroidales bacterium]MDY0142951.1 hypothetical protein [Bacteroidales bacterium]
MKIKYLKHNEINKNLWDDKINHALNGTVYAMSWYLDIVSPNWEALVTDDYKFLMPLPVKSKYGFRYLTQPALSQQLGVFSDLEITEEILQEFINKIPYKFYRLQFNSGNYFEQNPESLRPNYLLSLQKFYKEIFAGYNQNCKRNIKKAQSFSQTVYTDLKTSEFWDFIQQHLNFMPPKGFMPILKSLLNKLDKENFAEIWSVRENNTNEIYAAVLLVKWENKVYYLMPSSSDKGKKSQAMVLLLNEFIEQNSETNIILDFEGSSISGVERFYKSFGAIPEFYPVIYYNGLGFPFNKIIK